MAISRRGHGLSSMRIAPLVEDLLLTQQGGPQFVIIRKPLRGCPKASGTSDDHLAAVQSAVGKVQ